MEGQTAAGKGPERGWLLLPKTRGFGRRSGPLSALEALTTSGREEEEERFPYGRPRGAPNERGPTRGEEEEGIDLPLLRDRDTARLEEIWEKRCTCETTSARRSSLKRPDEDPGVTVRERR